MDIGELEWSVFDRSNPSSDLAMNFSRHSSRLLVSPSVNISRLFGEGNGGERAQGTFPGISTGFLRDDGDNTGAQYSVVTVVCLVVCVQRLSVPHQRGGPQPAAWDLGPVTG